MLPTILALAALAVPNLDADGFALPPGAVARIGSLRYRVGEARVRALAPDGRTLAVATADRLAFWDVATGRVVRSMTIPDATTPFSLAYSPDGKSLVYHADDNLHILDPTTGGVRWSRRVRAFESGIRFSPGGTEFVLRDLEAGRLLVFGVEGELREVRTLEGPSDRWSPCDRYNLRVEHFEDDKGIKETRATLLNPWTGKAVVEMADPRLECLVETASRPVGAPWAVSPDGRRVHVLAASARLLTFDTTTGRCAEDLDPPAEWDAADGVVPGFVLSPDGAVAYLSESVSGQVWRRDLKAGRWLEPFPAMPRGDPVPHPDGKQVLHFGHDGLLRRYDLATRKQILPPGGFIGVRDTVPSPDGRHVAVASSEAIGGFAVYRIDGRLSWTTESPALHRVVWSPDGRQLAGVAEETITIHRADTGKEVRRLHLPPRPLRGLCGGFGSPESYRRRQLAEEEARALSDLGGRVADRAGALFELTQERIDAGWTDEDRGLRRWAPDPCDSPDGRFLLTWEWDGAAVLRDPRTGERLGAFNTGLETPLCSAFSPNGLWLAAADGDTVSLWDVPTGTALVSWKAPERVFDVSFAGSGKLVTRLADDTALVWTLRPRRKPAGPVLDALRYGDAHDVNRAVWALAGDPAGPELLRRRIPAAAALPAAERWIKDLDADRYAVRERASRHLAVLGRSAGGAMRTALMANPSAEARKRLEDVLAGLLCCRQYEELVHARAVLAMELAGTPAALEALTAWAGGDPGATLTMDAKSALGRLRPDH